MPLAMHPHMLHHGSLGAWSPWLDNSVYIHPLDCRQQISTMCTTYCAVTTSWPLTISSHSQCCQVYTMAALATDLQQHMLHPPAYSGPSWRSAQYRLYLCATSSFRAMRHRGDRAKLGTQTRTERAEQAGSATWGGLCVSACA